MTSLYRRILTLLVPIFLLAGLGTAAFAEKTEDTDRDLRINALLDSFEALENTAPAMELDSNEDGQVDYLIKVDLESGKKVMEVLDYNHDGAMDDFYFYEKGILKERAIDSNFDQMIDFWVYITEGIYINSYEKDSDFDGVMDQEKIYSSEDSSNRTGTNGN